MSFLLRKCPPSILENWCGTRPNGSGRRGERVFSLIWSACASFWNTRHTHLFLFDGIHPIQQTTEVESGVTNVAVSVRFIHFALDRPIPLLTVRTHSQAAYSECHYHRHQQQQWQNYLSEWFCLCLNLFSVSMFFKKSLPTGLLGYNHRFHKT